MRRIAMCFKGILRGLIAAHVAETGSPKGTEILRNWDEELPKFRQIVPKEMLSRLEFALVDAVKKRA